MAAAPDLLPRQRWRSEDRALLAELPRVRTDLRRGQRSTLQTLARCQRLLVAADRPLLLEASALAPTSRRAIRSAWLVDRIASAAGIVALHRRPLVTATLLADLDDDPERSAALASRLTDLPIGVARTIRQQNERIDGTGAPFGLTAASLPLRSQVVAIAVECGRRLDGIDESDRVDVGCELLSLVTESERGRWDRTLAATAAELAGSLAAVVAPTAASATHVRIDAAHAPVPSPVETIPANRETTGSRSLLQGLQARQSPAASSLRRR